MFNYPYDIINNTAQPHGNQKVFCAKGFSLQCAISGYFFSIGTIIGEWHLFIIAIRHPRYVKFSICKGLQRLMKRQKG